MSASPGRRRRARPSSTPTPRSRVAAAGEKVILVRRETNPDDLPGMIAAQGILTSRGGKTSHAAVVARGMGKTCVCGAEELDVDTDAPARSRVGRHGRRRGRRHLHRRHAPARSSSARCRSCRPRSSRTSRATLDAGRRRRLVARRAPADHATPTTVRRLGVRANADTAEDAARARRFGAAGHRPVPHRAHVPRRAPRSWSSG